VGAGALGPVSRLIMNAARSSSGLECLLIADDLTGACDAAVHFAECGLSTAVLPSIGGPVPDARVLAVSTDSRDLAPAEQAGRIESVAAAFPPPAARIVFKKIDSTLRGNPGMEIRAALDAFACEAAVITPALPVMGRVVEGGRLRVNSYPGFVAVEVPALIESQGRVRCAHVKPGGVAQALASGAKFVSTDAICDADLERVAAEILALHRTVLWAGSSGLASALARQLEPAARDRQTARPDPGPVLLCIGSDHPVTAAQQARLLRKRSSSLVDAETASADCVAGKLACGEHVVLRIPRGRVAPERIGTLLRGARAAGLFLCGGDTASAVVQALGVGSIRLRQEIVPGIPWGFLRGGKLADVAVATKSGGFGDTDSLLQVVDFFSCPSL
jgi:D-threonate/D-erythronate kinase